jgi:3D (Asp-Asp-Asp) domain-containing protein
MLFLLLLACSPTTLASRNCAVPATSISATVPVVEAEPETEVAKVTAYTADCKGCIGITRDGTLAESHKRILAADPRHYPMGTKVELTFPDGDVEVYTVRDTGGAIKGRGRFDMLVRTERFAVKWGVKHIKFRVVD